MAKDDLINDWLNEASSPQEQEELERIIAMTENMQVPAGKPASEAWDQLLGKIEEAPADNERIMTPAKPASTRRVPYAIGIAAALALLLYVVFSDSATVLRTGVGEQTAFTLPDNSEVMLNAGSSIRFDEGDWAETRTLTLKGEAFFDVTEGTTFTVETDLGNIQVLGTSFNIFIRDDKLEASCFSGAVRVSKEGTTPVTLQANQRVTIDRKTERLQVKTFNKEETATWRKGEFHFDEIPLTQVIDELERQFAITIDVSIDIAQRSYSGYFSNNDLNEALQLVFNPMGLRFEITGKTIKVQ